MNNAKNVSFFVYFKAMMYMPRQKNDFVLSFILVYIMLLVNAMTGILSGNLIALIIVFLSIVLLMSCFIVGNSVNNRPNLAEMLPLNHKTKLLYRFLSPIWLGILSILILVAAFVVFGLISSMIGLILSAFSNPETSEIIEAEDQTEKIFGNAMGVYGGIFTAAYVLLIYSAGMIYIFLKRKKHRIIFWFCFMAFMIVSFLLMVLPYSHNIDGLGDSISPFVAKCYEPMAMPWLCVAVWCLIAVAAFGTAVYLGIKSCDPKKY